MKEDSFSLKIVAPSGAVLEDEVSQVNLPASDGEIGVLPKHSAYTALLGTGVLEYFSTTSRKPVRLVICRGFCSFSDGELTLLPDEVVLQDGLERESYGSQRKELTSKIENMNVDDPEWTFLRAEIDKIEAIDALISH